MKQDFRKRAVAVATVMILGGGCAGSNPGRSVPADTPATSAEEYEALYLARLDSARMRFTEVDVRFMSRMIHHHAQAIEMAELAPERTRSPRIRTLAARIINAQQDEIATMRRWLQERGQTVPHIGRETDAHAAMDHAQHPEVEMPGMLSPEELRRLSESRGLEFDRIFLTSMIRHHQGAVTMVEELFATDGAAQDEEVFKFASDAQVDQATEVARMEAMLRELSASSSGR